MGQAIFTSILCSLLILLLSACGHYRMPSEMITKKSIKNDFQFYTKRESLVMFLKTNNIEWHSNNTASDVGFFDKLFGYKMSHLYRFNNNQLLLKKYFMFIPNYKKIEVDIPKIIDDFTIHISKTRGTPSEIVKDKDRPHLILWYQDNVFTRIKHYVKNETFYVEIDDGDILLKDK